jgi:predicted P-loop ATPase
MKPTDNVTPLLALLKYVRTDARTVRYSGGSPYKEDAPITRPALEHHLADGPALGVYPIRSGESTCQFACLDLDDHSAVLTWDQVTAAALSIITAADAVGLRAHPWRSSGGRGIHLLFVWAQPPQDARSVRALLRTLLTQAGFQEGAAGLLAGVVEIFPKQNQVEPGAYGSAITLPGAFDSVPLCEFTLQPLSKLDIAGVLWRDSDPVPRVPDDPPPKPQEAGQPVDLDAVAGALAAIPNSGTAQDYDTWFRVTAAVHACDAGSRGLALATAWSAQSTKHDVDWFAHCWEGFNADRAIRTGAGTLFHLARQFGWQQHAAAVHAALDAIDVDTVAASISAPLAKTASSTLPKFRTHPKSGDPLPCLNNVRLALEHQGCMRAWQFGYDNFRDELMVAERPGEWRALNDVDVVRLRLRLETMRGGILGIGRDMMRDALIYVADAHQFDSAILWLNGLQWDGVPRAERFLTHYFSAADTPYVKAVSLYLWTALAGRVLEPGIQADMAPILVGEQGEGKSTGLQEIAPAPEHFTEISLDKSDDDLARLMRGRLIVELAELKGLSSREAEHTKAFVTRRFENWVPKYREFATTYARRCVLIGTTNENEFLEDSTGNRRYLPVRVGTVKRAELVQDRLQLWAEARVLFEQDRSTGGHGILWQDAERLAKPIHDEFTVEDAWTEDVARWLDGMPRYKQSVTATDVLKDALELTKDKITQSHKKRVVAILRRLGFRDSRKYVDGRQVRLWEPGQVVPGNPDTPTGTTTDSRNTDPEQDS